MIIVFLVCNFSYFSIGRRWPIFMFHAIAGFALLISIFIENELVKTILSMVGKFGITGSFGSIFLWTPEIVPTTLRTQGIGIASVGGRAGNIVAPFSSHVVSNITV